MNQSIPNLIRVHLKRVIFGHSITLLIRVSLFLSVDRGYKFCKEYLYNLNIVQKFSLTSPLKKCHGNIIEVTVYFGLDECILK